MKQKKIQLKENEIYKGFKVLSISQIPEYESVGIYLKHEKTGLEIFHMLNDDKDNFFSFGFKTFPFDSCGTAHILEHSVLEGSKNYPIKAPYKQFSYTVANAFTSIDKTIYFASTLNETDYFNLMAVYGDAVFFPLLREETFKQEGWRREVGKNGKLYFQGVVLNEMKGDYSSLKNVMTYYIDESLFPDSSYSYDSGGDPICIPDLTYEKLKEFHEIYYHPINCKIFLYGNIDTKKQLDFINEKFLSNPELIEKNKINVDFDKMSFSKKFDKPKYIKKFGPIENSSKETNVVLCWKSDDSFNDISKIELECIFTVLLNSFNQLVDDHNLLEYNTSIYCYNSFRYFFVTIQARCLKKGKEKEFEKLILTKLEEIVKQGVSKEIVEKSIKFLNLMYTNKEQKNYLMNEVFTFWMNGANPTEFFIRKEIFEEIKDKIKNQPNYLENLIKKYFLDNPNRVCLTVIPDKNFNKKREKILDKKVNAIFKGVPRSKRGAIIENIKEETKKLNEYQQSSDATDLHNLIQTTSSKKIKFKFEKNTIKRSKLLGVEIFENQEKTKGDIWIDLCFPIDLLEPKDYKYLGFYLDILPYDYKAKLYNHSVTQDLIKKANATNLPDKDFIKAMYDYDPVVARRWIFITKKMNEEKADDTIKSIFSFLKEVDFSDLDTLSDMLTDYKKDFTSSIILKMRFYALRRSTCKYTKAKCIDELYNGLSQFFALKSPDFAKENIKTLKETLERIHKTILDSGFVVNITAEKSGLKKVKKVLETEISSFPYYKGVLKSPFLCDDKDFYDLVDIQGESSDFEQFVVDSQVGCYAQTFKSSHYGTSNVVYESMVKVWLSDKVLWEQLRTIGGCYNVDALNNCFEGLFGVATNCDPNPYKSKEMFENIFNNIDNWELDEAEFERIKSKMCNSYLKPILPSSKGFSQFMDTLYGVTDEMRRNNRIAVFNAKLSDVVAAGKELCKNAQDSKSVIIFSKTEENAGKIVDLHL